MSLLMNPPASASPTASLTFVPANLINQFDRAFRHCVERRAFELYERAGRLQGRDWEHWLQAESEYLFAPPRVLESRDRYSLIAIVRDKPPRTIQICLAPRRVIVRTKLTAFQQTGPVCRPGNEPEEQFLRAQWTEDISPATANATLDGRLLTITAWKVHPENSLPPKAAASAGHHSKT